MIIKVDSEVIAEVRNALTIIQLNAQTVPFDYIPKRKIKSKLIEKIIEQVKRIDSLLPPVKFEG